VQFEMMGNILGIGQFGFTLRNGFGGLVLQIKG